MTVTQLEKAKRPEKRRERLPLVLEILPGQAAEGLVVVFEPGDYEHLSLKELAEDALSRRNLSIEEQMILEDIHRQLQGGKLLVRGREVQGSPLESAVVEETEAGEKYLYVPIRAIKPQEGGLGRPPGYR
ncbi:MAG: hypothetical protein JRI59_02740 [Deltaproteobacteria bacterium]|nr:hypothetical protein [Deltaproteobacteria bacterium]